MAYSANFEQESQCMLKPKSLKILKPPTLKPKMECLRQLNIKKHHNTQCNDTQEWHSHYL